MSKEIEIKSKFNALYIDPIALKKIQYWADAASGEVSGLGIIEIEDGNMVVKEAFILEQECTGADTELNPEAISKLMTDIIKADKDPGKLKFWWHSHVNMGVFWSGTDDECAETLSTEFAFSLVVNKSKERRVRLDLYKPFRITIDHVKLIELSEDDNELKDQCKKDVEEKVKSKSFTYERFNGTHYFKGHHKHVDPYDYDEDYEIPKNWGKRVRLSDEDLDDVKKLEEIIYQMAYNDEALDAFVCHIMSKTMKYVYEDKANCEDGPGTFIEGNAICSECNIASVCKDLSSKFCKEETDVIDLNDVDLDAEDKKESIKDKKDVIIYVSKPERN